MIKYKKYEKAEDEVDGGLYMKLTIFMDETSRTGQQRYNNDKWNFKEQPYFGLGALYIPTDKIDNLLQDLDNAISKENFQNEFKWANKAARGRALRLVPHLIEIINQNGAKVYFEIEDKRFSIAKIITDYCIVPYYTLPDIDVFNDQTQYIKRAFASYIADNMSDDLLWEICDFFDSNTDDTQKLKIMIQKISEELDTEAVRKYCTETIEYIKLFESNQLPLKTENLFPVRDVIKHNGIETTLTIDPHTDCFSDLLKQSMFLFPNCKEINCIHDVQDQWEPALKQTIERINGINIVNCVFSLSVKTGYDVIINTVDYILGYLNFGLKNLFIDGTELPEMLKILCESNLTLVASASTQQKVFGDNPEIIVVKHLCDTIASKDI